MFLSPKALRFGLGLAALAVVAVVTPILLGHAYGQSSQESPKLTFDVTSIHEWGPGQGPTGPFTTGLQFSAGRVRAQCVNLRRSSRGEPVGRLIVKRLGSLELRVRRFDSRGGADGQQIFVANRQNDQLSRAFVGRSRCA